MINKQKLVHYIQADLFIIISSRKQRRHLQKPTTSLSANVLIIIIIIMSIIIIIISIIFIITNINNSCIGIFAIIWRHVEPLSVLLCSNKGIWPHPQPPLINLTHQTQPRNRYLTEAKKIHIYFDLIKWAVSNGNKNSNERLLVPNSSILKGAHPHFHGEDFHHEKTCGVKQAYPTYFTL